VIVNENGEWESKSDREEEGPRYDEDHENNDNEIQRKRMGSDTIFSTHEA